MEANDVYGRGKGVNESVRPSASVAVARPRKRKRTMRANEKILAHSDVLKLKGSDLI